MRRRRFLDWARSSAAGQIMLAGFLMMSCGISAAEAVTCKGNKNALGVTRTLKIDAAGGPLFGSVQYRDREPLGDKEVVLTFDDGPLRPYTREVLKALAAHCTKATFFMVGRMAVSDPAMVREVAAAGHTVAAHTWSHKNLKSYTPARAAGEIELGVSAVEHALGKPIAPFFRFPYLADPKAIVGYLQSRNVATFSIDVDSNDFRTRSGDNMRRTVMRRLESRGRGIILMHDIQRSTARGIAGLLDDLARGGYKVVHIEADTTFKSRPEYNQHAAELHKRRRSIAQAEPLQDPSIKWAQQSPSRPAKRIAKLDEEAPKPNGRQPATRTEKPDSRPAPVARPSSRPRRRVVDAPPKLPAWRRRVLGLD